MGKSPDNGAPMGTQGVWAQCFAGMWKTMWSSFTTRQNTSSFGHDRQWNQHLPALLSSRSRVDYVPVLRQVVWSDSNTVYRFRYRFPAIWLLGEVFEVALLISRCSTGFVRTWLCCYLSRPCVSATPHVDVLEACTVSFTQGAFVLTPKPLLEVLWAREGVIHCPDCEAEPRL